MAIYSCSVKVHSRSKGETATGGAAYRLGLNLTDERTGLRFDYSRRGDVADAFTLLPVGAPEALADPAVLWNAAEAAENRKNSCVSREVLVALPHEMTDQQRSELARDIGQDLVDRFGVGLSVGIHRPEGDGLNFHAHILMTTRRVGPDGLTEKTRELDDKKQGVEQVQAIRAMVADLTNRHLQRHGYEARVDHRSLDDQKQAAMERGDLAATIELTREPTLHHGRKPEVAARVKAENERRAERSAELQQKQLDAWNAALSQLEQQGRLMPEASDARPDAVAEASARVKQAMVERKEKRRAMAEAGQREASCKEAAAMAGQGLRAHEAGAKAWAKRAADAGAAVDQWKQRHALLAFLGLVPKAIQAKADKARACQAKEAEERRQAAEQAKEAERLARRAVEAAKAAEAAREAYKAAERALEAAKDDKDRIERHEAWRALPMAEQQRRLDEAASKLRTAHMGPGWPPLGQPGPEADKAAMGQAMKPKGPQLRPKPKQDLGPSL